MLILRPILVGLIGILFILYFAHSYLEAQNKKQQEEINTLQRMVIEETDKNQNLLQEIENLNNMIKEKDKQIEAKSKAKRVAKTPEKVYYPPKGDCYEAMKRYFPQSQWDNASLVIRRESGGRSNAVSATDDHGCFQIHGGLRKHGVKIYDPDYNAYLAYNYYFKNRGWTPWYAVKGILW